MNMKQIPVFIHHEADEKKQTGGEKGQKYVAYCVRQAESCNDDVVLFGDRSNCSFANHWEYAQDFLDEKWKRFKSVFINYSDFPEKWAEGIFKRFFIFENYMIRNRYERCIVLDSDVLAFVDFSRIGIFRKCPAAVEIPYDQDFLQLPEGNGLRQTVIGAVSCFTLEALTSFTDFCIEIFANKKELLREKIEAHRKYGIPGGICEMTILYHWLKTKPAEYYINLFLPHKGMICDSSFSQSDLYERNQFEMDRFWGHKIVKFSGGGIPRFYTKTHMWQPVMAIHFQGWSKIYMKDIYENHRIGSDSKKEFIILKFKETVYKILKRLGLRA